ncbi:MAG TPA: hypothetical protein VG838_00460 [Opitutaceae bacterium]|nr:hypothetical protein [Opitutaceae bacterium]
MKDSDFQAVMAGINTIGSSIAQGRDAALRKAMLARQVQQDQLDNELKKKQLDLESTKVAQVTDPTTPDNQLTAARVAAAKQALDPTAPDNVLKAKQALEAEARGRAADAQASAVAAKPVIPEQAQFEWLRGLRQQSQAALLAAQQKGDQQGIVSAQGDLDWANKAFDKYLGKAGVEPTVNIEMPSDDGLSKVTMKVPQSQWNPSHPMWSKFNTTPPAPSAGGMPTLTPDQAKLAKPGTKYKTTDGRILVR